MTTTSETLKKAVQFHKQGDLHQAERLYQQIVRIDPEHADALHLLGVTAHQQHQSDVAVKCIRRAIELNSSTGMYFVNLGQAYLSLNRIEEAVESFQHAIRLEPTSVDGHLGLAAIFKQVRKFTEAENCLRDALTIQPENRKALFLLGELLKEQLRHDQAIECYRQVLQLRPDDVQTHVVLGNLLAEMNHFEEAIEIYERSLILSPSRTDVMVNLGSTYKFAGRFEDARSTYHHALKLNPKFSEVHVNLGNLYQGEGQVKNAIAEYEAALAINPNCADAYLGMGIVLKGLDRFKDAAICYKQALKIRPNSASGYNQLGLIHRELGNVSEALTCYENALEIQPEFAEARFNHSLVLLLKGDFDRGSDEYEWRWKRGSEIQRDFEIPRWNSGSIEGQSLVIAAEQGLGDEIMFAGCLPKVIEQSDRCFLECDRRLVTLFQRSFPDLEVFGRSENDLAAFSEIVRNADLQISMGSLPRLLKNQKMNSDIEQESQPPTPSYLVAENELRNLWATRFAELEKTVGVGISWRGGKEPHVKRKRSTLLSQWAPVLSLEGISFVNLQYGETAAELAQLEHDQGITIHDWDELNPVTDLENYAAAISALDLVITVDNSTAHLAGALGVPTWTLLPFAPDWRWGLEKRETHWYQSMRLLRQDRLSDWDSVFQTASEMLSEYPEIDG